MTQNRIENRRNDRSLRLRVIAGTPENRHGRGAS